MSDKPPVITNSRQKAQWFRVKIPTHIELGVAADNGEEAVAEAQRLLIEHLSIRDLPEDHSGSIHYEKVEAKFEGWYRKDLAPTQTLPQERLAEIYKLCFSYGGPRIPFSWREQECRDLFAQLDDEQQVMAHGAFSGRGVILGDSFKFPRVLFYGDWDVEDGAAVQVLRGYNTGRSWNGFACPLLERETIEALAVTLAESITPEMRKDETWHELKFDGDDLIHIDGSYADEPPDRIVPVPSTTVDGVRTLYEVSLGWTWGVTSVLEYDDTDPENILSESTKILGSW